MNVMAQAHKMTQVVMENGNDKSKGVYTRILKEMLKHYHKEYKAMQTKSPVELLKVDTIAKF